MSLKAWFLEFRDSFGISEPSREWLNKRRLEELEIKRQELALQQRNNHEPGVEKIPPIIWLGAQRELAAFVVDLYEKKKILAPSRRQAVVQSAAHFLIQTPEGEKAIDGESLWRNYSGQIR